MIRLSSSAPASADLISGSCELDAEVVAGAISGLIAGSIVGVVWICESAAVRSRMLIPGLAGTVWVGDCEIGGPV